MDKRKEIDIIYLGFHKAFDIVPHYILISKIEIQILRVDYLMDKELIRR